MKKPAEVAYAKGPSSRLAAQMDHVLMLSITDEERRLGLMPKGIRLPSIEYMTAKVGEEMEIASNMLTEAQAVLSETITETRQKYTQLMEAANEVNDGLLAHVQALRSSRMACTSEIQQSLGALRDIRKFFIESDYAVEMERLERFVKTCEALRDLKADGTLDVVTDIALKLALSRDPIRPGHDGESKK